MKTKLNTKTIVAAVASVIGLAVYGYTSMVGYLAASATSTLPVVLTVAALGVPGSAPVRRAASCPPWSTTCCWWQPMSA